MFILLNEQLKLLTLRILLEQQVDSELLIIFPLQHDWLEWKKIWFWQQPWVTVSKPTLSQQGVIIELLKQHSFKWKLNPELPQHIKSFPGMITESQQVAFSIL